MPDLPLACARCASRRTAAGAKRRSGPWSHCYGTAAARSTRAASLRTIDGASRHGTARKILVVDDNRDATETLALLLRGGGHEVRVSYDGVDALHTAASFRPALVLLDIGMPRLDGHEVARPLRAQPWGRRRCIVALSGFGQAEDRQRSLKAGCDEHLIKPLSDVELSRAVNGPAGATRPEGIAGALGR